MAVSAGAACSSGTVRRSAVLEAMGFDKHQSGAAVRVSLGWNSTTDDTDAFVKNWNRLAAQRAVAA